MAIARKRNRGKPAMVAVCAADRDVAAVSLLDVEALDAMRCNAMQI